MAGKEMDFTTVKILGQLLVLLSTTLLIPMLVEAGYQDGTLSTFQLSFCITFGLGFLLWFPFRRYKQPLRTQDGFLIVALFWLTSGLVGALPFYWSIEPSLSFTDAFFESVAGVTTTGSTILTHLDHLPHSILYYRQQLQFLGGISIILLAVAILPTLGIGGMQFFRTEITGPVKDDKLTPRITHTAKAIWVIYFTFTILCALGYWIAGMSPFDAITHSFGTVSTGGFSTHDKGLAYFSNPIIICIAILFMLLGSVSFNLHFLAFKRKKFHAYWQDPELLFFLKLFFSITLLVWATAAIHLDASISSLSLLDIFFQVASSLTTTGYASYSTLQLFPHFIPFLLLFCAIMGGCAGSTSGGIKAVRVLLLQKQGTREIQRLIHPRGQYVITLGTQPISTHIIEAIWGFFAIYMVVFASLLLLLLMVEEDFLSIYTALVATLSNSGPGLGKNISHFAQLSDYAKWILSAAMLLGRLEIFTILVLLSPSFWRR